MNRIYLDHNATTPMYPKVLKAMLPYFKGSFGNASSIHSFGQEANRAVEKAREQVALLVGAEPREVIFTSGGTESDNFAIRGVLEATPKKRHVVTSPIEHHAVIYTLKALEKKGLELTTVGVDGNGRVDPAEVASAVRPDTALVTIMFANNEMGTVQPIAEIGGLLDDVVFHTDGVQALGKIPIRFGEMKLNLLSLSSHKIHGLSLIHI